VSHTVGLVGKPSVGESTFLDAATMNDAPEGASPFTTIDSSVGEAYVRVECAAPEFGESCTPSTGFCRDGARLVPIELVDVAGLIPSDESFAVVGAVAVFLGSEGGLGTADGRVLSAHFLLPREATTEKFAYCVHSDPGEGLLHGVDCRAGRQVGADHEPVHRDVVELVTTN